MRQLMRALFLRSSNLELPNIFHPSPVTMTRHSLSLRAWKVSVRYLSTQLQTQTSPKLAVRWFYATDVPTTKPDVRGYVQKQRASKFIPFSQLDSRRIESQYQQYLSSDQSEKFRTIPVNEDALFDCDLKSRLLKPAYWSGPAYEVRRGTWFSKGEPVAEAIANQLEQAYNEVKPYESKLLTTTGEKESPPHREVDLRTVPEAEIYKRTYGRDWPFEEEDEHSLITSAKDVIFVDSDGALLVDDATLITKFVMDSFLKSIAKGMMSACYLTRGYKEDKGKEETNKEASSTDNSTKVTAAGESSFMDEAPQSLKKTLDDELADEKFQKDMEHDFTNDPAKVENSANREVDHLILCIHGIGQSLSSKFAAVNFPHDTSCLRGSMKKLFLQHPERYVSAEQMKGSVKPRNCKVQALPIVWRYDIDFSLEHECAEHAEDGSPRLPRLKDLNIDAITSLRTLAADVVLDILLYYEPSYRRQILTSVVRSANNMYDRYLERHPGFKGKVSFCGHSLGSVIGLDILCAQPNTMPTGKNFNPDIHLKFPVENFFCMGSPNGVFKFMKGQNIRPRSALKVDPDTTDPQSLMDKQEISPKVNNLYNIFSPTDIVAYRMEPLVHTAMSKYGPKVVPFADEKNINTMIDNSLTMMSLKWFNNDVVKGVASATGLDSQYQKALGAINQSREKGERPLQLPKMAAQMLCDLNRNGRIDYSLPQSYFEIDLINALGSHTQYLSDPNVANFLLLQLWGKGEAQIMGSRDDDESGDDLVTSEG